jgi:hypothetical protein
MKEIDSEIEQYKQEAQSWTASFDLNAREAESAWQQDYGTVHNREKYWETKLGELTAEGDELMEKEKDSTALDDLKSVGQEVDDEIGGAFTKSESSLSSEEAVAEQHTAEIKDMNKKAKKNAEELRKEWEETSRDADQSLMTFNSKVEKLRSDEAREALKSSSLLKAFQKDIQGANLKLAKEKKAELAAEAASKKRLAEMKAKALQELLKEQNELNMNAAAGAAEFESLAVMNARADLEQAQREAASADRALKSNEKNVLRMEAKIEGSAGDALADTDNLANTATAFSASTEKESKDASLLVAEAGNAEGQLLNEKKEETSAMDAALSIAEGAQRSVALAKSHVNKRLDHSQDVWKERVDTAYQAMAEKVAHMDESDKIMKGMSDLEQQSTTLKNDAKAQKNELDSSIKGLEEDAAKTTALVDQKMKNDEKDSKNL